MSQPVARAPRPPLLRHTDPSLATLCFPPNSGQTPRHFTFDGSGQFLIVANQDSDTIAVFSFNMTSGEIKYTGNEYKCPSPNFICKVFRLWTRPPPVLAPLTRRLLSRPSIQVPVT